MKFWALLMLTMTAVSTGWSEEVTVYRLQVGAFSTREAAESRQAELSESNPRVPVHVAEVEGPSPYKVRMGRYPTYEAAKAAETSFEASGEGAFVVSEVVTREDATRDGIAVPENLYEREKVTFREAEGLSEATLVIAAENRVNLAASRDNLIERRIQMREAMPYLTELAENHPAHPKAGWARHHIASQYLRTYYEEQHKRQLAGAKRASATEEAAIRAAIENYEKVVENYPDYQYAEKDAYEIASLKASLRKTGIEKDNQKRAIEAYREFVRRYPNSRLTGRARMNIAGIEFEKAKSGRTTIEAAYAAMESVLSASETLGDYERGRTQLMMAEIQMEHRKDFASALAIIQSMDLGPEQDLRTATSAKYLMAEAYRGLEDYANAVRVFQDILANYQNTDGFTGFDLHPICLFSMGECQMKLGRWQGAYDTFTRLKSDWPNDVRAKSCDHLLKQCEAERRVAR